eukprot:403372449
MIKGKQVIVKLNDGTIYRGTYICLDGNLNTVLEKCEELNKDGRVLGRYGDIFIRGNNVCYIAPYQAPQESSNNENQASGQIETNMVQVQ